MSIFSTALLLLIAIIKKNPKRNSSLMLAFILLWNSVFSKNIYAIDKDKIEKSEDKVVEMGSSLPYPTLEIN